jgi:hypothetical protein
LENVDALCATHFSPLLQAAGFAGIHPRRWVRAVKTPVREIFEIQALKGASYSARWGFSLDFVPLYRGRRFKWKRTDKGAEFDICIDPVDESGDVPGWCSFSCLPPSRHLAAAVSEVATRSIATALTDFDEVASPGDIVRIFERRSMQVFKRFGPDNYVQTHLAWALCLAAIGPSESSDDHLLRFCEDMHVSRDDHFLIRALAAASQATAPVGP